MSRCRGRCVAESALRWLAVALVLPVLACGAEVAAPAAPPAAPPASPTPPAGQVGAPLACDPGVPSAAATLSSGPVDNGTIVPIGRMVTPAGVVMATERWPIAAAFSPDGAYLYVTHNGQDQLDVFDVAAGTRLQTVRLNTYRGLAVAPGGATVFAGGAASGTVFRLAREADGTLTELDPWHFDGYVADVALTADGTTLYVLSNSNSRVWRVDAATGEVLGMLLARVYPYDLVVAADGTTVYVSNTSGDDVSVLDFAAGEERAVIPTDLNPMGMALSPDGGTLYVADSDADVVTVIDTQALTAVDAIDVRLFPDQPVGGSPNEVALSADGTRLYVSQADLNMVDVVDTASRTVLGRLPTEFYATGVALSPDGGRLAVCNSKGHGAVGGSPNNVTGSVSLVDLDFDDAGLAAHTAQVTGNNGRTLSFYPNACPYPIPKALADGPERPVAHVVLILKENKTYDAVFGDFARGRGDPALAVFGAQYTPNAHALAERYALLDNYYCDSEHSTQGHNWATQADANDLFEKTDNNQFLLIGYDPSILSHQTTIFNHFFDHDVSFRIYGQFVGVAHDWFRDFEPYVDQKVPFFNMSIRDVVKAQEFIRELNLGIFPQFVFLALPNDHTFGTKAGKPLPEVMVADNDHALGMVIEALSRHPDWEHTIVFVIEDDAQGYGGDHIHPQRSLCLVIGPWARKAYTSSVHYSMPSVFRTIEMLFDLPPMNLNTATAAPMYDMFLAAGETPDTTPYTAIVPDVPYAVATKSSFGADLSERMDFAKPDGAPGLGYVLWHHMKGPDVYPPPYAKWVDE